MGRLNEWDSERLRTLSLPLVPDVPSPQSHSFPPRGRTPILTGFEEQCPERTGRSQLCTAAPLRTAAVQTTHR